jgi:hypothetical protein
MKKMPPLILVLAALSCSRLNAQDISGDWQGTLNVGSGLRTILRVAKSDTGGWTATLPNASHGVFASNDADVRREMNDFLAKLP